MLLLRIKSIVREVFILITEATVIAIDGKFAIVENERKSACEGCHKNTDGACSICSLAGGNKKISMKAHNKIDAEIGDRVAVETVSRRVLWYALVIFIFPIVSAILGYFIGNAIFYDNRYSMVLAMIALVCSFVIVAVYSKIVVEKRCDAEIIGIIKKSNISCVFIPEISIIGIDDIFRVIFSL